MAYPMCLFRRLRTNMSLKAPMRSCFKALPVESYFLCSLVALANWRRISEITEPMLPEGTVGSGPGLVGGTKAIRLRVLKTAGVTVIYSHLSVPSPRWDCIEAALWLSCRCTSAIILYPG